MRLAGSRDLPNSVSLTDRKSLASILNLSLQFIYIVFKIYFLGITNISSSTQAIQRWWHNLYFLNRFFFSFKLEYGLFTMLCDSSSFRVKSRNYSEESCVLIQAGLYFIRQKQFTSGQVNIHSSIYQALCTTCRLKRCNHNLKIVTWWECLGLGAREKASQ